MELFHIFLKKKDSTSNSCNRRIKCSFANLVEKFLLKTWKHFSHSPKMITKFYTFPYLTFMNLFVWAPEMQFWQSCRKNLPESQKIFTQCLKSFDKYFCFRKKRFPKMSPRSRKMQKCQSHMKKHRQTGRSFFHVRIW